VLSYSGTQIFIVFTATRFR